MDSARDAEIRMAGRKAEPGDSKLDTPTTCGQDGKRLFI